MSKKSNIKRSREEKINVYIFIYTYESQIKRKKKEIIYLYINIYYKIVIYIFK